jgi:hypothetical protein
VHETFMCIGGICSRNGVYKVAVGVSNVFPWTNSPVLFEVTWPDPYNRSSVETGKGCRAGVEFKPGWRWMRELGLSYEPPEFPGTEP